MQTARHFAAAARGGGARVSDANSNSNIGSGEVTNRRRWLAMTPAISGKLGFLSERNEQGNLGNVLVNQNDSGFQSGFLDEIITNRRLIAKKN
jgi:hypothetical protein